MKKPILVKEKEIHSNTFFDIIEKIYRDENKEANVLSMRKSKGRWWELNSVWVLAIDKSWNFILEREYKLWIWKEIISFPMWWGKIWNTSKETAVEELEEEIWYTSGNLTFLWSINTHYYVEDIMDIFLAKDCYKTNQKDSGELEVIEELIVSEEEINKMLLANEIKCPMLMAAYHLAKAKNLL